MIYVDTSVVLAALLAEDRRPAPEFWAGGLVSSRLLEYETWVRLHGDRSSAETFEAARWIVGCVELVETTPTVLARALDRFPVRVRTLDALHLATADYLRAQGMRFRLATYDARLTRAATLLKLDVFAP